MKATIINHPWKVTQVRKCKCTLHIWDINDWLSWVFTAQITPYDHVEPVNLPNHTFSWAGLGFQAVKQYLCTFFHQKLTYTVFVCVEVLLPCKPNWGHVKFCQITVLRFYCPVNPTGVMSSSVRLPNHTFSWAGLVLQMVYQYLSTFFHQKLTNCLSWISERERMNVEYISWSSPWKNDAGPSGDRTRDLLITSLTCIQLSHWGRHS